LISKYCYSQLVDGEALIMSYWLLAVNNHRYQNFYISLLVPVSFL